MMLNVAIGYIGKQDKEQQKMFEFPLLLFKKKIQTRKIKDMILNFPDLDFLIHMVKTKEW